MLIDSHFSGGKGFCSKEQPDDWCQSVCKRPADPPLGRTAATSQPALVCASVCVRARLLLRPAAAEKVCERDCDSVTCRTNSSGDMRPLLYDIFAADKCSSRRGAEEIVSPAGDSSAELLADGRTEGCPLQPFWPVILPAVTQRHTHTFALAVRASHLPVPATSAFLLSTVEREDATVSHSASLSLARYCVFRDKWIVSRCRHPLLPLSQAAASPLLFAQPPLPASGEGKAQGLGTEF